MEEGVLAGVTESVTEEMHSILSATYTSDEVVKVVKEMHPSKA